MRKSILTLLKIILSIPIGMGIAYPFLHPDSSGGILTELKLFGPIGSVVAIAVFLLLVLFYVLDLIKSLKLVSTASRKAKPNSVWLMMLLPYNFIEDFFIVSNVAQSLKAEAAVNPALARFKSFGMISGLGWCCAQIVSLIPNKIGSAAGLVAIVFWIWHWIFIRRANNALLKSGAS
ncbi:MAG: hypothetical protein E6Q83_04460 [Thiothrix sp.]|nr:MAG: hypothetical protein E6Q83_04460 [Thiothrix sp.]